MIYIGTQSPNCNALGTPGVSLARYLALTRFAPQFDLPEPARPARLDGGLRVRVEPRQPTSPPIARLRLAPLTTGSFVHVYTDRISKAVREAIGAGRGLEPAPGFHWSLLLRDKSEGDSLRGVIGLPQECDPELLLILEENPALVMQTELILSARVFQQCRFDPLLARLSVGDILDDRGIERHKGRGHKEERLKQQCLALRFLTSLEVEAEYWAMGRERTASLNGAVWKVPEDDRAALWQPRFRSAVFTIGRGKPFFNMAWAFQNEFAKPIGAGLLRLSRQKAAVLLGGYLATVAPMHKFRPKLFDVETLTAAAGLAGAYAVNPKRQRERLEEALDALQAAGVIGSWKYAAGEQVRIAWPRSIEAVLGLKATKGRCRA